MPGTSHRYHDEQPAVAADPWHLRADAVERVLSYVQMVMSFAVYGGQFLISGVLSRTAPGTWSMPVSPFMLLYPGTWFGSYLELASGRHSTSAIVCAAANRAPSSV